mmetsp:Transcript_21516/g.19085  ORF Transcript_21516/g.19085 Transcript_21516/m.19085 type:complete len:182 (+) Transcript_21516:165-710(+)
MMICDVFFLSNDYFKYDEIVQDMEQYTMLTDSILDQIMNIDDPELEQAQKLVQRLDTEDFYNFIDRREYTGEMDQYYKKITPEVLSSYCDGNLSPKEIRVDFNKFNFALGSQDPLEHVGFFKEENPDTLINLNKEQLKEIVPERNLSYRISCFAVDKKKHELVKEAFSKALKDIVGVKSDS